MIKNILKSIILVALSFVHLPGFSQNYEKEFESIFAWEVKQIDEFIERFNNTDKTLIREYTRKVDPGKEISRERLIKSLFNAENTNWNFEDINSFIKTVNDTQNPVYLNFYDNDWYAKVSCSVTWKGSPQTATLTLRIQRQNDGSSKWIIAGVKAPFLRGQPAASSFKFPSAENKSASLNPVSHATDFMNIDQVSRDKKNIGNYFLIADEYHDELPVFVSECLNNRLSLNKANAITYYFLQVDNWIFEIRQYNRQTKNSGWLISKLIRANAEEKEKFRAQTSNK